MVDLLSHTEFRKSQEYYDLLESTRGISISSRLYGKKLRGRKIYRHCNDQGRVVHIFNPRFQAEQSKRQCKECTCEHVLFLDGWNTLWTYSLSGKPITPSDYFIPILAGYLLDGQKGFLATDFFQDQLFIYPIDQTESVPYGTSIPVLRYEPKTYPRHYGSWESRMAPKDGLDPTGPLYWAFVRNLPPIG